MAQFSSRGCFADANAFTDSMNPGERRRESVMLMPKNRTITRTTLVSTAIVVP